MTHQSNTKDILFIILCAAFIKTAASACPKQIEFGQWTFQHEGGDNYSHWNTAAGKGKSSDEGAGSIKEHHTQIVNNPSTYGPLIEWQKCILSTSAATANNNNSSQAKPTVSRDASACLSLTQGDNPKLQNNCNFSVNARYCVDTSSGLLSCRKRSQSSVSIPPGEVRALSAFKEDLMGNIYWAPCAAPTTVARWTNPGPNSSFTCTTR
jgi:hypothetical protein